ncbi:MAG: PhoU domain-containing protein, partial [Myxococcota bacterium]
CEMGHYEQRLEADKKHIRDRVAAIGERVRHAIDESVQALLASDHARSYAVILGDLPINREVRATDARCHAFVARHLPSAGHLRFVSSTMRMTVALERIGDYAVTIAREAVQLSEPPPDKIGARIQELAVQANDMLRDAMRAYVEGDEDLARETKPLAGSVHRAYDRTFRALLEEQGERSLKDLFALLVVFNRIERVSDQAKNICEETLFAVAGETKPPKVYRVLFVDDDNTLVGPLVTAMARKSFPSSGSFQTVGIAPQDGLSPRLQDVAEDLGLELEGLTPSPLPDRSELAKYHVLVALSPGVRKHLEEIPFHTVFLDWHAAVGDVSTDAGQKDLVELSRRLAPEIRELMVTLRGEDAA